MSGSTSLIGSTSLAGSTLPVRSPGLSSYRARVAVRVAGGALLAAVLALGLWGYRRPELFLDLARLPFC